jgi:class 3 adenylate cyclase/uncharacterized protein YggT (Ycf19 family)
MAYWNIWILRMMLKLVTLAFTLLLLSGFVAQFLPTKQYPWVLHVQPYTSPMTQVIGGYIPTVYKGIDFSLLLPLVVLWYLSTQIGQWLWISEYALRRRSMEANLATRREEALKQAKSESPSVAAPSSAFSKAPVYGSEAIVVIDLVNSTYLVTQFGNTFLLMLKHRLEHQVNQICSRHAAGYSKSTGDGFLICFPSLANAVVSLREIFQATPTMNEDLPEGAEVALRAGLNFGEVLIEPDGDRTGGAVHKTFRIEALTAANLIETEGGIKRPEFPEKDYILASEEAVTAVAKVRSVGFRFLGLCELKGFPGLHRIYQI